MSIVGLTVSETGESLQRLAVTTKVAIGEVVKTATGTRPNKLDHFIFLRKGVKLEWEPDPELSKQFGTECREFWIILLNDEIENVFRTEFAWWNATEKRCWGDGRNATRRTKEVPDGEAWTPCGKTCPDLEENLCKPSGDLYFVLADHPKLGSVCRIHTTSYRSVSQIYSALEQIRTVTGGRLAGIRCKLVVRPEKATYFDKKKDAKVPTTIYALNLELGAADMQKLIGEMTQHAKLFEQTRKLLGNGRKVEFVVDEEAEEERAPDVAREFYPATDIEPAKPIQQPARASANGGVPKAQIPSGNGHAAEERQEPIDAEIVDSPKDAPRYITEAQRRRFFAICNRAGMKQQQAKDALLKHFGLETTTAMQMADYDVICTAFETGNFPDFRATAEDMPF